MNSQQNVELSRDERLGMILAEWLEAVEAGHAPDAQDYLRRYPEFAAELGQHLGDWEKFPRANVPNALPNHAAANGTSDHIAADTPLSGTLGDFRILREVGRGGIGIV